jgi:hypothetical protein
MRSVLLVLAILLIAVPPAGGETPARLLVIFVHGRYENTTGDDWTDDDPRLDRSVVPFDFPTPLGAEKVYGVSDGRFLRKRVREWYFAPPRRKSMAETVEKRVGRQNCFYVRYDAKDAWYYEPTSAPLVADEVRGWLLADPARQVGRNIVWIAHSNGGLIVRAIMSDGQKYDDLIAHTREVITLGTPHRGSDMADAAEDTDRIRVISDTLVDLDATLGNALRVVDGGFSVFKMVAPSLKPYLARVKQQTTGWAVQNGHKSEVGRRVRRAQADFVARVFEHTLSGRIDQQLTTRFMEATQMAGAPHRLLPAAELPVPFWWIRGDFYPMNPLRMIGGVFQATTWDDADLLYFAVSTAVVTPRLIKRWPEHPEWQRNDGVVSVESAAALGQPLGGNADRATFPVHHNDLLFNGGIRKLVDRHLAGLLGQKH